MNVYTDDEIEILKGMFRDEQNFLYRAGISKSRGKLDDYRGSGWVDGTGTGAVVEYCMYSLLYDDLLPLINGDLPKGHPLNTTIFYMNNHNYAAKTVVRWRLLLGR